jgi:hypothetical protein
MSPYSSVRCQRGSQDSISTMTSMRFLIVMASCVQTVWSTCSYFSGGIVLSQTINRHLLTTMSSVRVFCNRCGKGFVSQVSLLNHQNQHSSNCWKTYSIMLQAQQAEESLSAPYTTISKSRSESPTQSPSCSHLHSPPALMSPMSDPGMMDVTDNYSIDQETNPPPFHTKVYPGAAWVCGQGQTFMDIFDEDEHARKRDRNLYYPFATQTRMGAGVFSAQIRFEYSSNR